MGVCGRRTMTSEVLLDVPVWHGTPNACGIYIYVFVIHAGLASGLGSAQHIRQRGMVPCSNHHVELSRRYVIHGALPSGVSLSAHGWVDIYITVKKRSACVPKQDQQNCAQIHEVLRPIIPGAPVEGS